MPALQAVPDRLDARTVIQDSGTAQDELPAEAWTFGTTGTLPVGPVAA